MSSAHNSTGPPVPTPQLWLEWLAQACEMVGLSSPPAAGAGLAPGPCDWAVARPGPPGYHPSFGRERLFGDSKAEAQVDHSSNAVAAAESLLAPADPLEDAARFALASLEARSSSDVLSFWSSQLAWFRRQAATLRPESASQLRSAPAHLQSVVRAASPTGVHVALFAWACAQADVPGAEALGHDWLHGFPLVGDVPVDPIATPKLVKAALLSPAALLAEAPARSARLAARASRPRPEFGDGDAQELWDSTLAESSAGRISALLPWSQADQTLPVCRRFGVRQASSTGRVKLRVIDDFAENGVNDATAVTARIRMSTLVGLRAVARRLYRRDPSTPLLLLKADFKAAYRCAPIALEHLAFARLLIAHPVDGSLWVADQWAMPFGAIGAVYAWDRIGSAVTQILARLFWLPLLRYVDDLFMVIPADLADGAYSALHECVSLLGLVLDPGKSPRAAPEAVVLGVSIRCAPGSLTFRVDAAKAAFWREELLLFATHPALKLLLKLVGRLAFGCQAVWGPRAAARLAPLFRALSDGAPYAGGSLAANALAAAVGWWRSFLDAAALTSAVYALRPAVAPPCLLYTDAEGYGGLGACLYRDGAWAWWQARCPALIRDLSRPLGYPEGLPVFLYEAAAPFVAVRIWQRALAGRRLLLFVDNLTALGAFRKGRSVACPALNQVVHQCLVLLHSIGCASTIFWVPSRFNIADPASRGETPPGLPAPVAPPGRPHWVALRGAFVQFDS